MNDQTDQQLLCDYVERKSEAAFAAIVQRYVDLVHTAAFRMVNDAHAAKDVTQSVFVVLAQNARQLTDRPALAGWLHNTARNLAAKSIRSEVRRRAREQEAAVMNELLSDSGTGVSPVWSDIAPHLDDALGELSEPDRDAVLLRYFKNHDLRTVGATLGISDDAAQKRVSRAVERLREFFAKRGVTVGASGLAVVISANAVQAAPVGLALTISTAAVLTGTTLATTATITATKAIAMTALQKTIVSATIAVLAGAGIYEARQASKLRDQVQTLQQQQAPLKEEIAQLRDTHEKGSEQLTALRNDIDRLSRNSAELMKLRGEVGRLRADNKTMADEVKAADDHLSKVMGVFSNNPPIKALFSTASTTTSWQQTIATGGWTTPSGKRVMVLATPQLGNDPNQVIVKTQILEYTDESGKLLGLDQFNTTDNFTGKANKLSADQVDAIIQAAKNNDGVQLTRNTSAGIASGRQVQIKAGDITQTPSGEEYSIGPFLQFTPTVADDGQSVHIEIATRLNYLLSATLQGNPTK